MNDQEKTEFLSNKNQWVEIFDALEIPKTPDHNYNPPDAEKILVICRGGNTRSVATAFLLKYKYMRDAVAVSLEKNNVEVLETLACWASKIIVTEIYHVEETLRRFPKFRNKMYFMDLGPAARLHSNPFEIPFLIKIDEKLKEWFHGK